MAYFTVLQSTANAHTKARLQLFVQFQIFLTGPIQDKPKKKKLEFKPIYTDIYIKKN